MADIMPGGTPGQGKKSSCGCWFWGCITVIVVFIVALFGIYFGVKHYLVNKVVEYSTTTPLPIPASNATQSSYDTAKKKMDDFKAAMDAGKGPESLSLTGQEINSLIAFDKDWQIMKDKLLVDIQGDVFNAKFNFPLDGLNFLENFSGRYVNGEGTFTLSIGDGKLKIDPTKLTLNGNPAPDALIEGFRQLQNESFTPQSFKNPKQREFFEKLKSLEVHNGAVTITRK